MPKAPQTPPLFEVISEVGQPDLHGWMAQCDYRLATIPELRAYLAPALADRRPVGCDWETSSLNVYDGSLAPVGFSCSMGPGSARYVPLAHLHEAHLNQSREDLRGILQALDAAGVHTLWYHYRYDAEVCQAALGWEPKHWDDVLVAVHLLDNNIKDIGLKATSRRLLHLTLHDFTDLAPDGTAFASLTPDRVLQYACADADCTRRIWKLPAIEAAVLAQKNIYEIEQRLQPCIREGMRQGVYLDLERVRLIAEEWGLRAQKRQPATGRMAQLEQAVYAAAGKTFDLHSAVETGKTLVELGVPLTSKTPKTGQFETGKEILASFAHAHPVVPALMAYRKADTLTRNYAQKLRRGAEHFGPLVRFAFNPIGAPSGRMSSGAEGSEEAEAYAKGVLPLNAQSLPDPKKEPDLPNLRAAVIANDPREPLPDDPWVLVSFDYNQMEMRVAGNLSHESTWIQTYADPTGDIHLTNTRLAYQDVTIVYEDPRRKIGKTMGFAILFGGSKYTVAAHGGISVKQAESLIQNFFGGAPQLAEWIRQVQLSARASKETRTLFGRVRHLDEFFADEVLKDPQRKWLVERGKREAVNHPVQGTAADLFKWACICVRSALRTRSLTHLCQPVLWVHDELVVRARRSALPTIVPLLIAEMEFPVNGWAIPLKVEAEVGWNWGELIPWHEWQTAPLPQPARSPVIWQRAPVSILEGIPLATLG